MHLGRGRHLAVEGTRYLCDRHAVVLLKRRRLAISHDPVVLLEAYQHDVARPHDPRRGGVRLPQWDRQPQQPLAHDASSPIESSSEKTPSSIPVFASASFSDGPSVRVRTMRISGSASGSDSSASSTSGEMPRPKIATTGSVTYEIAMQPT